MMLLIPCIFIHSLYQPTNTLYKIQFVTSIKLLHVSAPECHPQGFYLNKEIQVQHTNLITDRPRSRLYQIIKII